MEAQLTLVLSSFYKATCQVFLLQAGKEPCDVAVGNTFYKPLCLTLNGSDDNSLGHWGNVVLKHLYRSLNDDKGGMERCTWEGFIHHPKISCATTLKIDFTARTVYILLG